MVVIVPQMMAVSADNARSKVVFHRASRAIVGYHDKGVISNSLHGPPSVLEDQVVFIRRTTQMVIYCAPHVPGSDSYHLHCYFLEF